MRPHAAEPPIALPPALPHWARSPWLVVAVAVVVYLPSLANRFAYDDNPIILRNPRIASLANSREIWLTDYWGHQADEQLALDPARDRLYRPLTLQSFALNHAIHGLHPFGYHLVNVALHGFAAGLVWLLARRLFADPAIALVAGLLFAVHPIHAEAVANVVGRAELLAAVFLLLGLIVLLPRGADAASAAAPTPLSRTCLALPAFLLALLAKENAISYPALALLTMHFAASRALGVRGLLVRGAILVAPLLLYFPLRLAALGERLMRTDYTSDLFNPLFRADAWIRIHGPLTILGHYARLMLVPQDLCCDYGLAVFDPRSGPELLTLVGVAAAVGLFILLRGYRRGAGEPTRSLAFLAAMFLVSYALISNTMLLIGVSLAERLFYWPSVFVSLGLAVALRHAWLTRRGPLAKRDDLLRLAGVALLVALAARGSLRSLDWRDDRTLFEADATAHPRGVHLTTSLAQSIISEAARSTHASHREAELRRADELLARSLSIVANQQHALQQRGVVALLLGDRDAALRWFEAAIALHPADSLTQAQIAELKGGAAADAEIDALRRDVAARPADAPAHTRLAQRLMQAGRNIDALAPAQRAAELAPTDCEVLRVHADALLVNLKKDEALAVLRRMLEIDERDWRAHANIAATLRDRDPAAALQHAGRAVELAPDDLRNQINYAEALALNGRKDEAVRRLKAIESQMKPDDPLRAAVAERIKELSRP